MAQIVAQGIVLALAAVPLVSLGMLAMGLAAWLGERRAHRRGKGLEMRVAGREDPTADMFWVRLEALDGRTRLPSFRPGQHVMVHTGDAGGRVVRRAYSLAAWQARPRCYELAIKREADGRASLLLHENLRPGAAVHVGWPGGSFHSDLAPQGAPIVLVAAGIGITPMRAMVAGWAAAARPPRVVLHHTARVRDELLFLEAFRELEQEAPWFSYGPRLTRESTGWTGASGRLDAAAILQGCEDPASICVFMCASHAMEDALFAGLVARGVPPGRVHRESFGIEAAATDIQAKVTADGREIAFDGHATLLHALEEQGIDIPADCRAGECGRCRFAILAGKARHVVTGAEVTVSLLACCSVPLCDMTLASTR